MDEKREGYIMTTPDGRTWWVERADHGRLKVTDIHSPTGYHEYISPQQLDPKYERPNLYQGVSFTA